LFRLETRRFVVRSRPTRRRRGTHELLLSLFSRTGRLEIDIPRRSVGTLAFMGEYFAFTERIRTSGHFLGGEALQPIQTATTVRVRNGKVSTTDGPFAETKEQLGGFYLINARDLNDAIQVASKIPSALLGSVEVRPIREFKQP
jgi:hypothetical protein